MKPPEWDGILSILALLLMFILTKRGPRGEVIFSLFAQTAEGLMYVFRQVEDFDDAVSRLRWIAIKLRRLDPQPQLSPEELIKWLQSVKVLQNRAQEIRIVKNNCVRNYIKRFYFAKKAGKEIERARNLIAEGEYLLWWAQARPRPLRDVQPQQPQDQLWGMDSYKKKVLDFMENKGTESQLLGVWGMRGVGKTSLLRLVRDSYPDKAFFGDIMFIGADTVNTVQHAIAIQFGLDWPMMSALDDLSRAIHIFSSLKNERFLLLLDDVQEPLRFEDIGLPIFSGRQQKIILATRNREICALMGCDADSTIEMRCLGEDDAWNLFKDEVQNEIIDVHPQVHHLAKQMVAECQGLPIAICTIARAMSTKRDLWNWSNAHDLLKDKRSPKQINEGYYCLDILRNTLQNSFLVTSVWPEDGSIPWSAEEEDGITQWPGKDVTIPWLEEDENIPWSEKNYGSIPSAEKNEDESIVLFRKEEDERIPWLQEDGSIGWLQKEGGSFLWFEKEDGSIRLLQEEDKSTRQNKKRKKDKRWSQKQEDGSSTWANKEEDGHIHKECPFLQKKESEPISVGRPIPFRLRHRTKSVPSVPPFALSKVVTPDPKQPSSIHKEIQSSKSIKRSSWTKIQTDQSYQSYQEVLPVDKIGKVGLFSFPETRVEGLGARLTALESSSPGARPYTPGHEGHDDEYDNQDTAQERVLKYGASKSPSPLRNVYTI